MTLLVGVLVASVLGSVHCAAMCGAFACTYVGTRRDVGVGTLPHLAYNGGRLVSYLTLGVIAGSLGAGMERIGAAAGLQRTAAVVAGVLMVAWAAGSIAAALGARVRVTAPSWMPKALGAAILRVREATPIARAASIGLLTTLLPCGWLYVFVATAAATGTPLAGAAVMGVFWLGTVPALLAVGLGAQRVLGPFAARLPIVSAIIVLVLGTLALTGRVNAPLHARSAVAAEATHAH